MVDHIQHSTLVFLTHKYPKHGTSLLYSHPSRYENLLIIVLNKHTREHTQAKTTPLTTLTVIPSDHFISTGNCFIYLLSLFRFIFNLSFLKVNSPWPSAFIMRSWKTGVISTHRMLCRNGANTGLSHHAWNIPHKIFVMIPKTSLKLKRHY